MLWHTVGAEQMTEELFDRYFCGVLLEVKYIPMLDGRRAKEPWIGAEVIRYALF